MELKEQSTALKFQSTVWKEQSTVWKEQSTVWKRTKHSMERTKHGLERTKAGGTMCVGGGTGTGGQRFDGTAPPLASVLMCGSVYTNNNIFLNYAHENNIKRMRSIGRRTEKGNDQKSTSCSSMCLFLVSPCPLVPFVTL